MLKDRVTFYNLCKLYDIKINTIFFDIYFNRSLIINFIQKCLFYNKIDTAHSFGKCMFIFSKKHSFDKLILITETYKNYNLYKLTRNQKALFNESILTNIIKYENELIPLAKNEQIISKLIELYGNCTDDTKYS